VAKEIKINIKSPILGLFFIRGLMAKLPNWIEVKNMKVVSSKPDWYLNMEIKVKYIPLRVFVKYILKRIGFRFWPYP